MWVVTVYDKDAVRMFEYTTKNEAALAVQTFKQPAILSFTK
ncbi:MAG: hypothetical protein ABS882_09345 [Lysinibacillus sp.]